MRLHFWLLWICYKPSATPEPAVPENINSMAWRPIQWAFFYRMSHSSCTFISIHYIAYLIAVINYELITSNPVTSCYQWTPTEDKNFLPPGLAVQALHRLEGQLRRSLQALQPRARKVQLNPDVRSYVLQILYSFLPLPMADLLPALWELSEYILCFFSTKHGITWCHNLDGKTWKLYLRMTNFTIYPPVERVESEKSYWVRFYDSSTVPQNDFEPWHNDPPHLKLQRRWTRPVQARVKIGKVWQGSFPDNSTNKFCTTTMQLHFHNQNQDSESDFEFQQDLPVPRQARPTGERVPQTYQNQNELRSDIIPGFIWPYDILTCCIDLIFSYFFNVSLAPRCPLALLALALAVASMPKPLGLRYQSQTPWQCNHRTLSSRQDAKPGENRLKTL